MGYRAGYEEDSFLRELNVKPEEFEFLAENCTKVIFSHFFPPKLKQMFHQGKLTEGEGSVRLSSSLR